MKQRGLERARSTVDGFLHRQCTDTTLGVLSVAPEMDGDGDEFLLIHLTYDDARTAIDRFLATPANVQRDFALHVLTQVRADA